MKKISKIFVLIVCTFVLALSSTLLTACSDGNPYSIKGVTLNGTDNCIIAWEDDATQQDKEDLWGNFNATNDEEFVQNYTEEEGEFYKSFTFAFNNNETVVCTQNADEKTYYYTQSEDLKSVRIYKNVEHTNGYCMLEFFDGGYCIVEMTDYNAKIYFKLQKA